MSEAAYGIVNIYRLAISLYVTLHHKSKSYLPHFCLLICIFGQLHTSTFHPSLISDVRKFKGMEQRSQSALRFITESTPFCSLMHSSKDKRTDLKCSFWYLCLFFPFSFSEIAMMSNKLTCQPRTEVFVLKKY